MLPSPVKKSKNINHYRTGDLGLVPRSKHKANINAEVTKIVFNRERYSRALVNVSLKIVKLIEFAYSGTYFSYTLYYKS